MCAVLGYYQVFSIKVHPVVQCLRTPVYSVGVPPECNTGILPDCPVEVPPYVQCWNFSRFAVLKYRQISVLGVYATDNNFYISTNGVIQ